MRPIDVPDPNPDIPAPLPALRAAVTGAAVTGAAVAGAAVAGAAVTGLAPHSEWMNWEFHAKVLAELSDGVVVADEAWTIRFANRAMARLYGYGDADLPGRTTGDLYADSPRRLDELRREIGRVALADGRWVGELNGRRRDRSRFISRAAIAPLHHEDRIWWVIVQRDVSDRKRLERAVIDAINQEQRRFASELHDGLGQELAGLSLMLASVAAHLPLASPAAGTLAIAQEVLTRSMGLCRTTAEGTAAFTLSRLGLAGGLASLATRAERLYGLACIIDVDPQAAGCVEAAVAYELYQIAQEALRNAGTHGNSTHCWLGLRWCEPGVLELKIRDDGRGFNPGCKRHTGMGLHIMRYRAAQIGASFSITARDPQGTVIVCRLELS